LKVLLTTSAAPRECPFSTQEKRPPLGLGFLISVLRNSGHEVFFIDNYLKPSNFLENGFLTKNSIDFVGIYANTICYRDTLRMFHKIQDMRSSGIWSGKIMVGGPHTTVATETIPEFVDYIVQGEGEKAIIDIVNGDVDNRIIRKKRIENLDSLPLPAYDYFVSLPYSWSATLLKAKPVFTLNTSRGCPFSCTFCSVGSIWGKKYTAMSANRIVDDIEYLMKKYSARGIYFREDNFTLNRKRVVEFCELLLKKNLNIEWMCETRVNTLSWDLISLMYRAGCRAYYLGIESGSQRVLDKLKKGITIEQSEQVLEWCNKIGMKTYASFMVGIPGETKQERMQTVYFSEKIRPTTKGMAIFIGIPKSELYDYVLENKLYEYIDDVGLVYLKGHNNLVDEIYGGSPEAKHPTAQESKASSASHEEINLDENIDKQVISTYYMLCARQSLIQNNTDNARKFIKIAIRNQPLSVKTWIYLILTFANVTPVIKNMKVKLKRILEKFVKPKLALLDL